MPGCITQTIAKARRALGLALVLLALVIQISTSALGSGHETRFDWPVIDFAQVPPDCPDANDAIPDPDCGARSLATDESASIPAPPPAFARVSRNFRDVAMARGLADPAPLRPPQHLPAQI